MRSRFSAIDCSQFKCLELEKLRKVDMLLSDGIPKLLAMVPAEQRWGRD